MHEHLRIASTPSRPAAGDPMLRVGAGSPRTGDVFVELWLTEAAAAGDPPTPLPVTPPVDVYGAHPVHQFWLGREQEDPPARSAEDAARLATRAMLSITSFTGRAEAMLEAYDRGIAGLVSSMEPELHSLVHLCVRLPNGMLFADVWPDASTLEQFARSARMFEALSGFAGVPRQLVLPVRSIGWSSPLAGPAAGVGSAFRRSHSYEVQVDGVAYRAVFHPRVGRDGRVGYSCNVYGARGRMLGGSDVADADALASSSDTARTLVEQVVSCRQLDRRSYE